MSTADERADACVDSILDLKQALRLVQRSSRRFSAVGYKSHTGPLGDVQRSLNEAISLYSAVGQTEREQAVKETT